MLLSGIVGLVVLVFAGLRLLLRSNRPDAGDFVAQNVLTRINTDYRDAP
jgi:hypothetical protein